MKKFTLFLSVCISFLVQNPQLPEMNEKDTGAIIKASYLYNFGKYVDWPEDKKTGNFIISVMGGDNLYQELVKNYNSKQIGSQQIEIRKLSKTLKISECHIIYIGTEYHDMLPQIAEKFKNTPTLIVSDGEKTIANGSAVAFLWNDNTWMFDINTANAQSLYVSLTLKSLARKVE